MFYSMLKITRAAVDRCLATSKLSQPLYRTDECLCEDIVVPVERVKTIVASGGIPLVRITQSPLGNVELEVVPYTPSSRFIVISFKFLYSLLYCSISSDANIQECGSRSK